MCGALCATDARRIQRCIHSYCEGQKGNEILPSTLFCLAQHMWVNFIDEGWRKGLWSKRYALDARRSIEWFWKPAAWNPQYGDCCKFVRYKFQLWLMQVEVLFCFSRIQKIIALINESWKFKSNGKKEWNFIFIRLFFRRNAHKQW